MFDPPLTMRASLELVQVEVDFYSVRPEGMQLYLNEKKLDLPRRLHLLPLPHLFPELR